MAPRAIRPPAAARERLDGRIGPASRGREQLKSDPRGRLPRADSIAVVYPPCTRGVGGSNPPQSTIVHTSSAPRARPAPRRLLAVLAGGLVRPARAVSPGADLERGGGARGGVRRHGQREAAHGSSAVPQPSSLPRSPLSGSGAVLPGCGARRRHLRTPARGAYPEQNGTFSSASAAPCTGFARAQAGHHRAGLRSIGVARSCLPCRLARSRDLTAVPALLRRLFADRPLEMLQSEPPGAPAPQPPHQTARNQASRAPVSSGGRSFRPLLPPAGCPPLFPSAASMQRGCGRGACLRPPSPACARASAKSDRPPSPCRRLQPDRLGGVSTGAVRGPVAP